jgi:hypothetical protein
MDLREVGCGGMDWMDLFQDRKRRRTVMNAVMKLRIPQNAENFLIFNFLERPLLYGVMLTTMQVMKHGKALRVQR